MRTLHLTFVLLAGLIVICPGNSMAGSESTRAVVKAIEARDCVAAVRELNLALAGATPEALLLGGAMFEQGLCLKQNVERASRLYVRAADVGASSARSRLAALYASPSGGPDKGAAIWWGLQAGLPLPSPCVVDNDLRGNAERFAQTLGGWPAGMLDACVYVTGVLATLDSEFVLKADAQLRGGVTIDFRPAAGRVDVRVNQQTVALVDNSPRVAPTNSLFAANNVQQSATPEQMRALQAQEDQQALLKRVESVSQLAIARFQKPASLNAEWRIQVAAESARDR
jgi:hypothetical protein